MLQIIFNRVVVFALLVVMQVLIFNNINILGYATPMFYVYYILKIDSSTSVNTLMLLGFLLGFIIDVFCDTLGLNAFITVAICFLRPYVLKTLTPNDLEGNFTPSFGNLGIVKFLKYSFYLVVLHHFLYYSIEFISFSILEICLRSVCSIFSTLFFIFCVEALKR